MLAFHRFAPGLGLAIKTEMVGQTYGTIATVYVARGTPKDEDGIRHLALGEPLHTTEPVPFGYDQGAIRLARDWIDAQHYIRGVRRGEERRFVGRRGSGSGYFVWLTYGGRPLRACRAIQMPVGWREGDEIDWREIPPDALATVGVRPEYIPARVGQ